MGVCENMTRSDALKLEHQIKKLPTNRKLELLEKGKELLKMANNVKIKKDLLSITAGIQKVAEKVEALATSLESEGVPVAKTRAPKKKVKRVPKKKTLSLNAGKKDPNGGSASQVVLDMIKGAQDGISTAALLEATGFDKRKIHNVTFRLKKAGIIKTVKRGIYQSV